MAYGIPGAIVARLPDRKNSGRRGSCQFRAAQVAIVPLSQVSTASSAASSSSTPTTYCGRDRVTPGVLRGGHLLAPACHPLLALLQERGVGALLQQRQQPGSACFASPTTGTSVAIRPPALAGSASICATRTLPGAGRCLV